MPRNTQMIVIQNLLSLQSFICWPRILLHFPPHRPAPLCWSFGPRPWFVCCSFSSLPASLVFLIPKKNKNIFFAPYTPPSWTHRIIIYSLPSHFLSYFSLNCNFFFSYAGKIRRIMICSFPCSFGGLLHSQNADSLLLHWKTVKLPRRPSEFRFIFFLFWEGKRTPFLKKKEQSFLF